MGIHHAIDRVSTTLHDFTTVADAYSAFVNRKGEYGWIRYGFGYPQSQALGRIIKVGGSKGCFEYLTEDALEYIVSSLRRKRFHIECISDVLLRNTSTEVIQMGNFLHSLAKDLGDEIGYLQDVAVKAMVRNRRFRRMKSRKEAAGEGKR